LELFFLVYQVFVCLEQTSSSRQTTKWMKERASEAKLFQDGQWIKRQKNKGKRKYKILIIT
jgi:phage anti-repressor protein